jgi:hypothetical protein
MIEITEGLTSITAGADSIAAPTWPDAGDSRATRRRAPTGVRVTLEFSRETALPIDQPVRVRYEFGEHGTLREAVGIAQSTHVEVRWGRANVYHYRLSHWIAPGALRIAPSNVLQLKRASTVAIAPKRLLDDWSRAKVRSLEAV